MTTKTQKLLEWIDRAGMVLESQAVGSGFNRAINALLLTGEIDIVPHPTVTDANGVPVPALVRRKKAT